MCRNERLQDLLVEVFLLFLLLRLSLAEPPSKKLRVMEERTYDKDLQDSLTFFK